MEKDISSFGELMIKLQDQIRMFLEVQEKLLPLKKVLDAKYLYVFDPAHILAVEAKTQRARLVLYPFVNSIPDTPLVMDYSETKNEKGGYYSVEYLEKIISFVTMATIHDDDLRVLIQTADDYPLTLHTQDFRIVLAPRIVSED